MGTVIFDFDSTLVACESLEELARETPGIAPDGIAELERITAAGMDGTLSFEDSLRSRLEIVTPTIERVRALGRRLAACLTDGCAALVERLRARGHAVWIVSGGFQEILLETGAALDLPVEHVHGVRCRWGTDGRFEALDAASGFAESKVEGVRRLGTAFPGPAIGVGDGATDLALREAGYVERFVAYTEHVRRAGVVAAADFEAADMGALERILANLLP